MHADMRSTTTHLSRKTTHQGGGLMNSTISAAAPVLVTETKEEVVWLTLNRPEKRNALSWELLVELDAALARIADDKSARAVVVSSHGPVFCSGHDLGEMVGCSAESYRDLFTLCSRVMRQFRRLPQPVIARVQGMATAAGCQLVAACDLAVAADTATFATPGVKLGLFCTTPMVPLVRAIPAKAALQMLLTGELIDASMAAEWGLVNQVVPQAELAAATARLAAKIADASSLVVSIGKQAFYTQIDLDQPKAYAYAKEVMSMNALAADAQEGISAFLTKRAPRWSGR